MICQSYDGCVGRLVCRDVCLLLFERLRLIFSPLVSSCIYYGPLQLVH